MQPFTTLTGNVAPLDRANVDTDQIIPKQFLKRIERTGFGQFLFFDWRFLADGSPNPDFELNRPELSGASVLLARRNFGCGSSREHAVWAVHQAGYKAVIAPVPDEGFADIFEGNSLNNGLLVAEIAESDWKNLVSLGQGSPSTEITVNLETQQVYYPADGHMAQASFSIPESARHQMLNGLDSIGITISDNGLAIDTFEKTRPAWS